MVDDRLGTLVRRLLSKTQLGELQWHEGVRTDECQANFQTYSVNLSLVSDEYQQDQVWMSIINSHGKSIERVSEEDFQGESELREIGEELRELYRLAKRQALGVDKAIDELLQQVG